MLPINHCGLCSKPQSTCIFCRTHLFVMNTWQSNRWRWIKVYSFRRALCREYTRVDETTAWILWMISKKTSPGESENERSLRQKKECWRPRNKMGDKVALGKKNKLIGKVPWRCFTATHPGVFRTGASGTCGLNNPGVRVSKNFPPFKKRVFWRKKNSFSMSDTGF